MKGYTEEQAIFDELAGKLEYDAGLPREEAERLARQQIAPDTKILSEWQERHQGRID